ncbi:unnamed protein product [Pleuronectes platessa]|uniref:Uncharacterized protein n=1 Tax=Pleuronectes platessa TaxID=8262 RepID=A0A9N7YT24_PLEPL|nr:unnamed protein product [Pleuronectes platessa]
MPGLEGTRLSMDPMCLWTCCCRVGVTVQPELLTLTLTQTEVKEQIITSTMSLSHRLIPGMSSREPGQPEDTAAARPGSSLCCSHHSGLRDRFAFRAALKSILVFSRGALCEKANIRLMTPGVKSGTISIFWDNQTLNSDTEEKLQGTGGRLIQGKRQGDTASLLLSRVARLILCREAPELGDTTGTESRHFKVACVHLHLSLEPVPGTCPWNHGGDRRGLVPLQQQH